MCVDPAKPRRSGQTVPPCINDLAVRRKVWFELDGVFVIGEGGLELLDAVSATGSLTRAARVVGWSYRHAWGYLRRAEAVLGVRLTGTRSGKGRSRGIEITGAARRVMAVARRAGWRRVSAAKTRANARATVAPIEPERASETPSRVACGPPPWCVGA